MPTLRFIAIILLAYSFAPATASSQTWQQTVNRPAEPVSTTLLLRDGRVLANVGEAGHWWILTPDTTGSYVNGTWKQAASLPDGYQPYEFSSAVLPDGRVIVEGGEDNNGQQVWTTQGAIYDPVADTWTPVNPPDGWRTIGDGASVVLANGTYMQANCCTRQTALLDAKTLTWTPSGNTKGVNNNEEGWVLLPDGRVLMVDNNLACGSNMSSELYDPNAGTWSCGPQLPLQLWGSDYELGSSILMYNGKVLQLPGQILIQSPLQPSTALFWTSPDSWALGPPTLGLYEDDGPAALMPNGHVLAVMEVSRASHTCQFVDYNPTTNTFSYAPNPPECPYQDNPISSRLLLLPTGQVLFTDFERKVEVYTPASGTVGPAAPTISASALVLYAGSASNVLFGKQLNGLSQGSMYGDDAQQATNYPLIQLVNSSSGNVYWATTHDGSSDSIGSSLLSYTKFDLNPNMPPGTYNMTVITNGIPSNMVQISVISHHNIN
jgi:hypothetical protein